MFLISTARVLTTTRPCAFPNGAVLARNEDIRLYLLDAAGLGVVPFQAFGFMDDTGWFLTSVGAVSLDEIRAMFARLTPALAALTRPNS